MPSVTWFYIDSHTFNSWDLFVSWLFLLRALCTCFIDKITPQIFLRIVSRDFGLLLFELSFFSHGSFFQVILVFHRCAADSFEKAATDGLSLYTSKFSWWSRLAFGCGSREQNTGIPRSLPEVVCHGAGHQVFLGLFLESWVGIHFPTLVKCVATWLTLTLKVWVQVMWL